MSIDEQITLARKELKNLTIRKHSGLDKILFPEEQIKEVEEVSEIKVDERKIREDKGKKRIKYDTILPLRYRQYLGDANKRSLAFELTVEEFNNMLTLSCVYCGRADKTGIDRIDSTRGYVKDNIQPCCTMCNMMKYRHSEEAFLKQVLNISRYRALTE